MPNHIEREFKWTISNRRAFDAFVNALHQISEQIMPLKPLHITDYYLDDKKGTLRVRKIALRIRHAERSWEATLKSRSCLKNGMAARSEITLSLPKAHSFNKALSALKQQEKWGKISLGQLKTRFIIRNYRRLFQVVYKECMCEAALDEYLTLAYGHQLKRREIELELKKGPTKTFLQLTKKLTQKSHLQSAELSKVAGAEKWISEKLAKTNF